MFGILKTKEFAVAARGTGAALWVLTGVTRNSDAAADAYITALAVPAAMVTGMQWRRLRRWSLDSMRAAAAAAQGACAVGAVVNGG